jgi:hypothetical protein
MRVGDRPYHLTTLTIPGSAARTKSTIPAKNSRSTSNALFAETTHTANVLATKTPSTTTKRRLSGVAKSVWIPGRCQTQMRSSLNPKRPLETWSPTSVASKPNPIPNSNQPWTTILWMAPGLCASERPPTQTLLIVSGNEDGRQSRSRCQALTDRRRLLPMNTRSTATRLGGPCASGAESQRNRWCTP